MGRLLGSAAGALGLAVGWNTHALPTERGTSQQSDSNNTLRPGCRQNATYAADFAFADRYRQLLEEGA
jgi:hypothetical protein